MWKTKQWWEYNNFSVQNKYKDIKRRSRSRSFVYSLQDVRTFLVCKYTGLIFIHVLKITSKVKNWMSTQKHDLKLTTFEFKQIVWPSKVTKAGLIRKLAYEWVGGH